jgi:hypothetical protein
MRNRIVLLDGESGCGKSALVGSGVAPRLQAGGALLPVLVRDWGDDWVRGPLAATLDALYGALTEEQRGKIEWTVPPDLAGKPPALVAELTKRLNAVRDVLQCRTLVIADQFDDYQAQHHDNFHDGDGNWLTPAELADNNLFWNLIRKRLRDASSHLLVVTRSDTSSGLSCIRFLDDTMTAVRTLPKVDIEYLRPLLAGIAPDEATPPVISNPRSGWHALRERLEIDFRERSAILMQQVRTVLLGLRPATDSHTASLSASWGHVRSRDVGRRACVTLGGRSSRRRRDWSQHRTCNAELAGASGQCRSTPQGPAPAVRKADRDCWWPGNDRPCVADIAS